MDSFCHVILKRKRGWGEAALNTYMLHKERRCVWFSRWGGRTGGRFAAEVTLIFSSLWNKRLQRGHFFFIWRKAHVRTHPFMFDCIWLTDEGGGWTGAWLEMHSAALPLEPTCFCKLPLCLLHPGLPAESLWIAGWVCRNWLIWEELFYLILPPASIAV